MDPTSIVLGLLTGWFLGNALFSKEPDGAKRILNGFIVLFFLLVSIGFYLGS